MINEEEYFNKLQEIIGETNSADMIYNLCHHGFIPDGSNSKICPLKKI
jgi:hypothetical protein